MRKINPAEIMQPGAGFSQGTMIRDMLFVAGQVAVSATGQVVGASDIRQQTRQTIRNVSAVLEAAGLTLSDIVSATVYISDLSNYPGFCEVWTEMFGSHAPARATIRADLVLPALLVEIQAIAVRPEA